MCLLSTNQPSFLSSNSETGICRASSKISAASRMRGAGSRSAKTTASRRAIRLVKSHGEISAAAQCVKEPCWSLTKQGCDKADNTGCLWDAVQGKVESLHPRSRKADALSEKSLRKYNNGKQWGNGGLSQRIAEIRFSATMTLLLKPRGDHPLTVFDRLMDDWRQVGDGEWTVRPIAAGNVTVT